MTRPPVGILAEAYYLPPTTKTVDRIFQTEDISIARLAANVDFQKDIGIDKVHLAADEPPHQLGLKAARMALKQAGVSGAELDLIIDFTSIPEDYVAPTWSAAGIVQHELGAQRAFSTAVNTGGCASFHIALRTAMALMTADERIDLALLFAGDKTPELNHTYYPITVVCDGGSAVVLKKHHSRRVVLAVEVCTVGELHDVWYMPGIARRPSGTPASIEWLYMKSDMKRFNESVIPTNLFMFRKAMKGALKKAGLKNTDVNYYIYPTFSAWDQKSFCKGLGIPIEHMYTSGLARHGHLQENDMVMNYVDAAAEGLIKEGDVVMVTTNGAGFVWGAALIRH